MIAAVESILCQSETTGESRSLIRHQVSFLLMAHRPPEVLSKVERDALRELKADKDLVIVPADKGRSTVVLDRKDYLQKAKGLLVDRQFYVSCATNPLKTLTREINATLLALEKSGAITPTDSRMARLQDTASARFYGLSKVPRPALLSDPSFRSKVLTAEADTTVSSSAQFLEKLKGVSLHPNEVMVSFDVTSLFNSIPEDLTIETIELLLQSKYDETENRLGHAQILQLLKLCLRTYFKFDGTIYEQVKGTSIGFQISGFIAEAVLQRLESLVFQGHKPKYWARYVEDTFVLIERDQSLTFQEHLHAVLPDIQFTMEEEDHPISHKRSCVRTLYRRVETHSSEPEDKIAELQYLRRVFKANGYQRNFVNSWCQLRDTVQSTAHAVLGRAPRQHQDWFDDNDAAIRNVLAEKNRLHKAYVDHPNEDNKLPSTAVAASFSNDCARCRTPGLLAKLTRSKATRIGTSRRTSSLQSKVSTVRRRRALLLSSRRRQRSPD
nr:unnamed protein product [Spirometra erinaceieuropaei]